MSQAVIIKSSKNGINLVLDASMPFPELLTELLHKFTEAERFFANASFAISFEGRELSDEEKYQVVDAIMEQTRVKILCILDSDEIRDAVIEQKCREMQQTNEEKEARRQSRGCFYRGSLLPGERLETEESIVIIGDVPQEAVVVSQSDIVVLGELSGSAFAGMSGNTNATITALSFLPEQYNIAGVYGSPMEKAKNSIFSKRNKTTQAKMAFLCDGIINIRSFS